MTFSLADIRALLDAIKPIPLGWRIALNSSPHPLDSPVWSESGPPSTLLDNHKYQVASLTWPEFDPSLTLYVPGPPWRTREQLISDLYDMARDLPESAAVAARLRAAAASWERAGAAGNEDPTTSITPASAPTDESYTLTIADIRGLLDAIEPIPSECYITIDHKDQHAWIKWPELLTFELRGPPWRPREQIIDTLYRMARDLATNPKSGAFDADETSPVDSVTRLNAAATSWERAGNNDPQEKP